jgi:hypothetical protein
MTRFFATLLLASAAGVVHAGAVLDSTFAQGGVFRFAGTAMSGTSDGGLLEIRGGENRMELVKYRRDGTRDMSFGRDGMMTLSSDAAQPFVQVLGTSPSAVHAEADGGFVMGADRYFAPSVLPHLLRVDRSGVLDSTFGAAGVAMLASHPPACSGSSISHIRPTRERGYLVAARGACSMIWRVDSRGTADRSFGNGGLWMRTDFDLLDLAELADGSIEVAGRTRVGASVAVARLSARGVDELKTYPDTGNIAHAAILADGSKMFAQRFVRSETLLMYKLRPDNTGDLQFGQDGRAIPISRFYEQGFRMIATPDGGILLLFSLNGGPGNLDGARAGSGMRIVIRKLRADGSADTSFGDGGTYEHATDVFSVLYGGGTTVNQQPDGYVNFVTISYPSAPAHFNGFQTVEAVRIQGVSDLVEFHNSALDHYFLAYDGAEARGIEAGAAGFGWTRTAQSFRPGGTHAVCRFYGTPGVGPNSHFFTIEPGECEQVKRDRGWTYEGLGFYATPVQNGTCAAPLKPVHRLYNNRWMHNDSNHRFTTSPDVVAQMQARGWVHEGVVFCAKP